MIVTLIMLFLAGVGNFAMHRWMLESGHSLVRTAVAPMQRLFGGHVTYVIEFAFLLAMLWLATRHWFIALCVYGVYTALNAAMIAWLQGMDDAG